MCPIHDEEFTLFCLKEGLPCCVDCVYSSNVHVKHETITLKKAANQVKQTQTLIENEIKSLDHFFNQNLQKSVLNLQTFSSSSLRSLLQLSKQFDFLFEKLTESKEILIKAEKEMWEERRRSRWISKDQEDA